MILPCLKRTHERFPCAAIVFARVDLEPRLIGTAVARDNAQHLPDPYRLRRANKNVTRVLIDALCYRDLRSHCL